MTHAPFRVRSRESDNLWNPVHSMFPDAGELVGPMLVSFTEGCLGLLR